MGSMMGPSLKWRVKPEGRGSEVLLEGDVAENVDFGAIHLSGDHVTFDAAKINRINSEGLRRLVLWLRGLAPGMVLEVKRCSCALVDQLNLVPELGALLKVRSLFVPVECEKCLIESEVLVDVPTHGHPVLPALKCKKCSGPMTMSEPSDRYFAFLEGN